MEKEGGRGQSQEQWGCLKEEVVLPGVPEEGKCFFASLSGKKSRERWPGKALLLEVALECDSTSLLGLAGLTISTGRELRPALGMGCGLVWCVVAAGRKREQCFGFWGVPWSVVISTSLLLSSAHVTKGSSGSVHQSLLSLKALLMQARQHLSCPLPGL